MLKFVVVVVEIVSIHARLQEISAASKTEFFEVGEFSQMANELEPHLIQCPVTVFGQNKLGLTIARSVLFIIPFS